jgi:membrane protein
MRRQRARLLLNTALRDLTPEARRKRAARFSLGGELGERLRSYAGPGTRAFIVAQRVITGVWRDGSCMRAIWPIWRCWRSFPFSSRWGHLFGHWRTARAGSLGACGAGRAAPVVAQVLEPVGRDVIVMRHGWLLWAGSAVCGRFPA